MLRYGFILNQTDVHNSDWDAFQQQYQTLADFTGDDRFDAISSYFSTEDQPYLYHALTGQWEQDTWSLLAEGYYISNTGDGFANTSKGWYASWFYHLGRWTPYVVRGYYSNVTNKDANALLQDTLIDYPLGSLGPDVDLLRLGTLDGFRNFRSKQRSWSLGTRFDFHPDACLKVEVEYFEFLDGTTGLMIPQIGSDRPSDAILTSFTIDVVF